MKFFQLIILLTIVLLGSACNFNANCQQVVKTGDIWPDDNGIHINAHGGGILEVNGTYYWYGEHKIEGKAGNRAMVGVHCYSSDDLRHWKDEGIALSVSEDPESPIVKGCIIERPKVIYNEKTDQFVMWFHHELKGMGYSAAKTGLAVANKATGPFEYVHSVNPNAQQWPQNFSIDQRSMAFPDTLKPWSEDWKLAVKDGLFVHRDFKKGQMARDMTLFVDEDGRAYHIHSSEENLTLHIAELNEEYTGFSGKYVTVMPGGHNEAPAVFKKGGKYFLITSGCTGWAPNAARSFVADHIMGPWTALGNPCKGTKEQINTTFNSQGTFILENPRRPGEFIFMADRWMPENAIDGRYIWLPILFEDGRPIIRWSETFN